MKTLSHSLIIIPTILLTTLAEAAQPQQLLTLNESYPASTKITLESNQSLWIDGQGVTPRITGIEALNPAGKPQINLLTGMQSFENGQMKSYPHRISLRSQDPERIKKPIKLKLQWKQKTFEFEVQFK